MQHSDQVLSGLISSRICHDLISPIGAVSNGLELLEMTGLPPGPEMDLVNQSARNASARVRYFRLAFGAAGAADGDLAQAISLSEVDTILSCIFDESRIELRLEGQGDLTRPFVKALLLSVMCGETALPVGGSIRIAQDGTDWRVTASSHKIRLEPSHWDMLNGGPTPDDIAPSAVQFALLPEAVSHLGRSLTTRMTDDQVLLRF